MTGQPTIQRIDHDDARVRAAAQAEQRLFGHYGLEYKEHYIAVAPPGINVRVLEVGSRPPVILIPGGNGESTEFVSLMAHLDDPDSCADFIREFPPLPNDLGQVDAGS